MFLQKNGFQRIYKYIYIYAYQLLEKIRKNKIEFSYI